MKSLSRYSRQLRLPEFGREGQERLLSASVLVVGAGGLGCPLITYLAEAGVGRIGIIDYDLIEESNLQRQPLYTQLEIGKPKAMVAAEKAMALNPDIRIEARQEKFTAANAQELLAAYDLLADCSDNFSTRYWVNDACVRADKPWVFAAIEGWQGQVSVFNFKNTAGEWGPTYRCLFPEAPQDWEAPDCDTIGVMATLPAVVGSIQANEVIKCLSGVGVPLCGQLLSIDLLENQYHTFRFKRNDEAVAQLRQGHAPAIHSETDTPVEIEVEKLKDRDYTLIDIREPFEWEEEPLAPLNIPYHDLIEHPEQLSRDKAYVLVCDQGKRSAILARKLRSQNSQLHVYSLKGGMAALRKKA